MGPFEWFLLIVVVILLPLAVAVAVTLWSLEHARQRSKQNRPGLVRRRVPLPEAESPTTQVETPDPPLPT